MITNRSIPYCTSPFHARRRRTRTVMVGTVGVGGNHPLRVQSMTTTPTQDVEATVAQCTALAEAGCEIIRITAQNLAAARALKEINARLRARGISSPLVADIHFLPAAAMEAAEHVEKVRINPGNYADKKRFQVREYSDALYESELQRLYDAVSPIIVKCRQLGRAMRIGTNHGSLSDRITNRYGDTPLGMVESALEFLRIADSHRFHDIILSMKASNPKVMIQAYRLLVARMAEAGMDYPLHLGVTEAGDGDDARIKSAIGIGSLLYDGLGDTIRVSLTEDPVYEIPVARDLARKTEALWNRHREQEAPAPAEADPRNPYEFARRTVDPVDLGNGCRIDTQTPPTVIATAPHPLTEWQESASKIQTAHARLREARVEGLFFPEPLAAESLASIRPMREGLQERVRFFVFNVTALTETQREASHAAGTWQPEDLHLFDATRAEAVEIEGFLEWTRRHDLRAALNVLPEQIADLPRRSDVIFSTGPAPAHTHPVGLYRALAAALQARSWEAPIWIRNSPDTRIDSMDFYGDRLLDAAILSGSLLCDGIGDLISVEHEPDLAKSLALAYGVLQGARARTTRTEFVACPSCGRTLFDLQETTRQIRARTGHLKGVTIAVMGCIVNGPGEMADADFGYVGGAPGKVNLYVGKTCVQYHIPTAEAVDRLIDLIKEHGRWIEPEDPA